VPGPISSVSPCELLFLAPKNSGLAALVIESTTKSSPKDGLRRFDGRRRISDRNLAPAFG
jgi:hypothetical protein